MQHNISELKDFPISFKVTCEGFIVFLIIQYYLWTFSTVLQNHMVTYVGLRELLIIYVLIHGLLPVDYPQLSDWL